MLSKWKLKDTKRVKLAESEDQCENEKTDLVVIQEVEFGRLEGECLTHFFTETENNHRLGEEKGSEKREREIGGKNKKKMREEIEMEKEFPRSNLVIPVHDHFDNFVAIRGRLVVLLSANKDISSRKSGQ